MAPVEGAVISLIKKCQQEHIKHELSFAVFLVITIDSEAKKWSKATGKWKLRFVVVFSVKSVS